MSLQFLILSSFSVILVQCDDVMKQQSGVLSFSLSQSLLWWQKSGLEEIISPTMTGNGESLSTQCLHISCDHSLFYFGLGSLHCVKLLLLKFSPSLPPSPTPSPNHDLASPASFQ